jgi:sucrose-6-phosphate hydrolase SacC (GH32 family)
MGLRHLDANPADRFFTGTIDEARIYGVALDARQIAALKPNQSSSPPPLAWWDFEDGRVMDRMKLFPTSILLGDARLAGGKLHLDKPGAYLLACKVSPHPAIDFSRADSVIRTHREKLLNDPFRPAYHFVTPEGRCMPFDPNGAIFWKGRYHGRPTMCYHQVGQGNAMAVALDDELNEWKKLPSNPITPKTKPGDLHHGKYQSWDPYGWLEGNTYYAIFGGTRPGLVKSASLAGPWDYVGDLLAHSIPGVSINEDVSCADFFPIGNRHMLLCISHRLGCRYYLGDWKDEKFYPKFHEMMSWVDNSYFAPESLLDDKGRRIMWAWIFDSPAFATRMEFGWSGTMSLPRVLTIGEDGRLRMNPPEEIERLRFNGKKTAPFNVSAGSEILVEGIGGNCLELNLEMVPKDSKQFGIKVCRSPKGEEQTLVYYDATAKKLKVDTNKSSLVEGPKSVEAGPLDLKADEPLKLRVFLDKSAVEVFANGRQAVMRRIYPSRRDSIGVAVFTSGGPVSVTKCEAWDMMPSNPY